MSGYSTGAAVADFNNDGNSDIYAANFLGGSSKVFVNQSRNKQTIKVKLEGTHSNRDAIGAKIYLYAEDQETGKVTLDGFQEISGGGGYASISAKEAIFPLRTGYKYFAIVKFPFPGSEKRVDDLKPGVLKISEESGLSVYSARLAKAIQRVVKDPDILKEYAKAGILLLLFFVYFRLFIHGNSRVNWIRKISVVVIFILTLFLNFFFLYSASLLLFFVPIFIAIVLLVITHLVTERIQIADEVSKQRLSLREKISRDLHDDLASTLGSIAIYADTMKRMTDPVLVEDNNLPSKIADLTQSALQSITDIIWMTSPRNDTLQGLLAKVNNLLYEVLTDIGIQYHADINTPDQMIFMQDELKNDTFLILKEAAHNIIRHSEAKNVTFIAEVNDHICTISLIDDGIGFDEHRLKLAISHGNGLLNIRQRALESKIDLAIHTHPGKGTFIHMAFQI
jgi:signal transduction histidine kinase